MSLSSGTVECKWVKTTLGSQIRVPFFSVNEVLVLALDSFVYLHSIVSLHEHTNRYFLTGPKRKLIVDSSTHPQF